MVFPSAAVTLISTVFSPVFHSTAEPLSTASPSTRTEISAPASAGVAVIVFFAFVVSAVYSAVSAVKAGESAAEPRLSAFSAALLEGAGVWGLDDEGEIVDFGLTSSLSLSAVDKDITAGMRYIFVSGALTDRFLNLVANSGNIKSVVLVVRDFTKIFVNEMLYRNFVSRGGRIVVLQKSRLVAVCVNPTAPNGYVLDSGILCEKLQEAIKLPVYDIVKNRYDF